MLLDSLLLDDGLLLGDQAVRPLDRRRLRAALQRGRGLGRDRRDVARREAVPQLPKGPGPGAAVDAEEAIDAKVDVRPDPLRWRSRWPRRGEREAAIVRLRQAVHQLPLEDRIDMGCVRSHMESLFGRLGFDLSEARGRGRSRGDTAPEPEVRVRLVCRERVVRADAGVALLAALLGVEVEGGRHRRR